MSAVVADVAVGDLVDAEYLADSYGTVLKLRGIVTFIGDFKGTPTHSVAGDGASTMSSTMPVHPVEPAGGPAAVAFTRDLLRTGSLSERARTRLEGIIDSVDGVLFS